MYKIEIDISDWGTEEKVIIHTSDFEKIETIREFIEFQQENGWAADYEHVIELDEEELEEDEDEPVAVSTYVITKVEE